jgi:hypothetical protein
MCLIFRNNENLSDNDLQILPVSCFSVLIKGNLTYLYIIVDHVTNLDSADWHSTVDSNRKLLCDCLRGYRSYLEVTESTITTKLQDKLSLPLIDLSRIDNELALAKRTLKESCEGHEL